jgi:hypothetical protein
MNDYIRVIGSNTERSSGDILVFDDIKEIRQNYGAYSGLISITSFKGVLIVLIIYFCI